EADSTPFSCVDEQTLRCTRQELRQLMWRSVSLSRDQEGLLTAQRQVRALRAQLTHAHVEAQPRLVETLNMLLVADLVIAAALERRESRGSHWRQDYQSTNVDLAGHRFVFLSPHAARCAQKEVAVHA
ncbi:MAG: hypothetical protein J2P36_21915, partial [Ktedonobacteraceae bacterium]|nr:hypothetical protein [Ktedonobacteraceae bacterium]